MDDEENDDVIEDDYYAFLNLDRQASQEEITEAYRRLSKIYHPDKHTDPLDKTKAENLFHKTKRAYEILSDPRQRAIYDCVGKRGLETEGWELVQRTRTAQEIRQEYERLERLKEQQRLERQTNPKVNFTVNINATELFPSYENEYEDIEDDDLPTIEISGVSCVGSVDAPLTSSDTATVSGNVTSHNGTGHGTVNLNLRRILSEKSWVECGIGGGSGPILNLKVFRTLSKRHFITTLCALQTSSNGLVPSVVTSLGWQIDKGTVGDITWRTGLQSSMSTSIHSSNATSAKGFSLVLGIPHSYVSVSYARRIFDNEDSLRLRCALKLGTFGGVVEYGAEKRVSKQSTITAAVTVGVPTGVTLKIKLSRANQTYSFPILLSEEVMASPIVYATFTPIVAWVLLSKFVIEPFERAKLIRRKEKQREANKARLVELRREAVAAKELMKATFSRIRAEEESRRGVVVIRALYGIIPDSTDATPDVNAPDDPDSEVVDVTVQLQVMVKDSKLFLHESSKAQLPGFYDPCVGDEKKLMVQYLFHNHLHQVTIRDDEPLRLPKNSHRVSST